MTMYRSYKKMPLINQADFPDIPSVPLGGMLIMTATAWPTEEEQAIANIILTLCAKRGKWCEISEQEIEREIVRYHFCFNHTGMRLALTRMINDGRLIGVSLWDSRYVIPTAKFIRQTLRYKD